MPTIAFLTVERPALVLGSTQPELPPAGIDVVRRRSGGGAVLVEPDNPLWMDVLVPAGDPLWRADVGEAFLWLGEAWAAALGGDATVYRGPPWRTPLARTVCFAGLSPGEVTVGGRKVVGISQRRTRDGALFQCAALLRWDPAPVARLTGVPAAQLAELAGVAAASGAERAELEQAVLHQLSLR